MCIETRQFDVVVYYIFFICLLLLDGGYPVRLNLQRLIDAFYAYNFFLIVPILAIKTIIFDFATTVYGKLIIPSIATLVTSTLIISMMVLALVKLKILARILFLLVLFFLWFVLAVWSYSTFFVA